PGTNPPGRTLSDMARAGTSRRAPPVRTALTDGAHGGRARRASMKTRHVFSTPDLATAQAAMDAAREAGVAFHTTRAPGMFGLYFREGPVRSFADAMASDTQRFNRFFHGMLERGVYLAPSAFEAGFVSSAHGEAEIAQTIEAARAAFAAL
ncbi:hypothetical protein AB4084_10875, partial [Lysobacter sp. 2RAB21]